MNSSEAAESIVKMSLEGMEVVARITGTGIERVAIALLALAKEKQKTKGETKLNNMLKSGEPLQIFSLRQDELRKFQEEAKKYGILYTALIDKKHPDIDGLADIMVKERDAFRVNHIFERFKLSAVSLADIKTEIQKDKMEEMLNDAKNRGIEIKSNEEKIISEITATNKEKANDKNPNLAKTEKSLLSEHTLENKEKLEVVSNKKKPSVRETLNQIQNELKAKEQRNKARIKSNNKSLKKSKKLKKGKER